VVLNQSINIGLMKAMSERMPLTKIHELDLSKINTIYGTI